MALSRYVPTRLLQACAAEAKACLEQAALGLTDTYGGTGKLRVYPYPLMPSGQIIPYQINIMLRPAFHEAGVGAVNHTRYDVEFDFFFPVNALQFADDGNSYWDHVYALRDWLYAGGTWPNQSGRIEDPDNAGQSIGTLEKFDVSDISPAPGNSAFVVPVICTFDTRETARGARA
jgi:hypothetical protein